MSKYIKMFRQMTLTPHLFDKEQYIGRKFHTTFKNFRKPAVMKPLLVRENIDDSRIDIESK